MHEGTQSLTGSRRLLRSHLFEHCRDVVGLVYFVEEGGQRFALNQPGGTNGHGGQRLEQFASGPGLQLEEALEVGAAVVGAYRVGDSTADLVQARKPRDGSGQGRPPGRRKRPNAFILDRRGAQG